MNRWQSPETDATEPPKPHFTMFAVVCAVAFLAGFLAGLRLGAESNTRYKELYEHLVEISDERDRNYDRILEQNLNLIRQNKALKQSNEKQ